jgi:hypothetical protein
MVALLVGATRDPASRADAVPKRPLPNIAETADEVPHRPNVRSERLIGLTDRDAVRHRLIKEPPHLPLQRIVGPASVGEEPSPIGLCARTGGVIELLDPFPPFGCHDAYFSLR